MKRPNGTLEMFEISNFSGFFPLITTFLSSFLRFYKQRRRFWKIYVCLGTKASTKKWRNKDSWGNLARFFLFDQIDLRGYLRFPAREEDPRFSSFWFPGAVERVSNFPKAERHDEPASMKSACLQMRCYCCRLTVEYSCLDRVARSSRQNIIPDWKNMPNGAVVVADQLPRFCRLFQSFPFTLFIL